VFVDQISPDDYLEAAASWVEAGAKIVGGCCGIGPEHISALSTGLSSQP
jgi:S-methylmethionine-dependent homocysteine/selenocysteine methylase